MRPPVIYSDAFLTEFCQLCIITERLEYTAQDLPMLWLHWNLFGKTRENRKTQECIPVGCVPPVEVAVMGGVSTHPPLDKAISWEQIPLWSRHPPEQAPPGAGTPPDQIPFNFPLGCGPEPDPLNFLLGCGPGPDPPQLPPWLWAWRLQLPNQMTSWWHIMTLYLADLI